MATALKWYNGGRVLVFVVGAFAEMSKDVSRICDIIAHVLARTHVSYYNDDSKRTKGMFRQRIQEAWGHTAHRGWARLLLNRARDLSIHDLGLALISRFFCEISALFRGFFSHFPRNLAPFSWV